MKGADGGLESTCSVSLLLSLAGLGREAMRSDEKFEQTGCLNEGSEQGL